MRTPKLRRLSDGTRTWQVRFRVGRRSTSETFSTERAAVRFAKLLDAVGPVQARASLDDETVEDDVPLLDQVAADHIEHLTGIEDGTRVGYRRLWGRTWSPLIGSLPANMVSRDDIAKATNVLAGRYSHKSLANQRGLLAAVCDRAVDAGYLTANPTKRLRLPRGVESEDREMRLLTHAELDLLVEAVDPRFRPLVRFLAGTGARWGEAVALPVSNLSLTGPRPTVRLVRAVKWNPSGERKIGVTKTKRSKRTIVLPAELVDELAELVAGRAGDALVFTAPRGGAVLHRTFYTRVWAPAVTASGVAAPRPRIHDLRHSHASWLLAQGVPIHVVQARLGHESITTTVDTYGHLLPDAQVAAAEAASAVFSSSAKRLSA